MIQEDSSLKVMRHSRPDTAGCDGELKLKDGAASADGVPIVFESEGSGTPAIVLVHGWSCDRSYWRAQAALSDEYRVVAVDLAGHGESGARRASWTMPAFGGDVAAVVQRLDLHDIVLVGHSMGGDVILEAALLLPGRVRGLVWVDTYPFLETPRTADEVEAFAAPFAADFANHTAGFVRTMFPPTADPALVAEIARDMAAAPPQIAVDALRHAFANQRPAIAAFERLELPLVQISPDDTPTDVDSLRRHGIGTVMVSGVGHFPMLEDPAQFNAALLDVIRSFA
jgi:pimeloyl-ACP methyl ester carboxylesterase